MELFKKRPAISIVVINYNQKDYIRECIDSIVSQDVDKEIICMDDHSTDGTFEILKEYEKKYKEIKVYRNEENLGTVLNRYNGLSHCSGDYELMVDADDILLPGTLKGLLKDAIDSKADIFQFDIKCDIEGPDGDWLKSSNYPLTNDLSHLYQDKILRNTLYSKIISRDTYRKVLREIDDEFKAVDFSDTFFFLYHFMMNAKSFASTDKPGYYYYSKRGMTSHVNYAQRLKMHLGFKTVMNELIDRYGDSDCLKYARNNAANQIAYAYVHLNEEEQEFYLPFVIDNMGKKNADFMIAEYQKLKKEKGPDW